MNLSRAKFKALGGLWEGVVFIIDPPSDALPKKIPEKFKITFDIEPWWLNKIYAKSWFTIDEDRGKVTNNCKGKFYLDRFLLLEYSKSDEHIAGFGRMILELSADNRALNGYVVGYGSHRQVLFTSKVILNKK